MWVSRSSKKRSSVTSSCSQVFSFLLISQWIRIKAFLSTAILRFVLYKSLCRRTPTDCIFRRTYLCLDSWDATIAVKFLVYISATSPNLAAHKQTIQNISTDPSLGSLACDVWWGMKYLKNANRPGFVTRNEENSSFPNVSVCDVQHETPHDKYLHEFHEKFLRNGIKKMEFSIRMIYVMEWSHSSFYPSLR